MSDENQHEPSEAQVESALNAWVEGDFKAEFPGSLPTWEPMMRRALTAAQLAAPATTVDEGKVAMIVRAHRRCRFGRGGYVCICGDPVRSNSHHAQSEHIAAKVAEALRGYNVEAREALARKQIDRFAGWRYLRKYGPMSDGWMDRLRDGIAHALATTSPVDQDTMERADHGTSAPIGVGEIGQALGEVLAGQEAMHCTRDWSAWGHGTMTADDFTPVAEDDEAVAELASAVTASAMSAAATKLADALSGPHPANSGLDSYTLAWAIAKAEEIRGGSR